MILFLITQIFVIVSASASNCMVKEYGENNKVCVCNSQHCDYYIPEITPNLINVFTSSQEGSRYRKTEIQSLDNYPNSTNVITINRQNTYQKINGFGGAFTDSTGINIMALPAEAGLHLMRSYFTEMGSGYNIGRVPMGGTDFSTHGYSYADGLEDKSLTNFQLAEEDFKYKIPLIKLAMNLSKSDSQFKLFTSTWIAPKWMKDSGDYKGGYLKEEHYQTWADYFLKFLREYRKQGLEFWGITTGNEPLLAKVSSIKIPSVNWNSDKASLWIRDYLGPTIRSSEFSDINIMAIDDQRILFENNYVDKVMKNETTRNYIDGFAVHWYLDSLVSPSVLSGAQERFPEKFILATEASNGFLPWQTHVVMGSWERGEKYAKDIIDNLNNWVTGWVDWNLVLDTKGGPTYINNFVDAAVIVNATAGEFYKQPMYYAIGHFSKFIPEGSIRIETKSNLDIPMVALTRPGDNKTVIVIVNKNDHDVSVSIGDELKYLNMFLERRSIATVIY